METECTSWGQTQTETDLLMECYCSWATDTNSRAKKTNSTPQVFEMSCRRPRCCCCCCFCCWVPLCYHTGSFIWEGFLDNVPLMLFKQSLFAKSVVCFLSVFFISIAIQVSAPSGLEIQVPPPHLANPWRIRSLTNDEKKQTHMENTTQKKFSFSHFPM